MQTYCDENGSGIRDNLSKELVESTVAMLGDILDKIYDLERTEGKQGATSDLITDLVEECLRPIIRAIAYKRPLSNYKVYEKYQIWSHKSLNLVTLLYKPTIVANMLTMFVVMDDSPENNHFLNYIETFNAHEV